MNYKKIIYLILLLLFFSFCKTQTKTISKIKVGAERTEKYLPLLKNKNVAIVANQTSLVNSTHIVDSLISLGVNMKKIFSPEHGFRGTADAGEYLDNYTDNKTGLPVISLYGKNKKPQKKDLEDIDILIFDIQDVGVRFYTYISSLHYIMEACAENNKKLIILDRPNPNGFYVDGPVLDNAFSSFVGKHPVPLVYGMTIAEYAQMINGENWLNNKTKCEIINILCENYTHEDLYTLPAKPSPNLPNMKAVYLYPSLGLFEGTVISIGRGTDFPFQVFGHPVFKNVSFEFKPHSIPGASKYPKFKDELCYGYDLRNNKGYYKFKTGKINLQYLIDSYDKLAKNEEFFNSFFNNLAGNDILKEQIKSGLSEKEIRKSWQHDLDKFKKIRKKYLLYKDF
ncbi:MAG: DUF1343 domain-containing protein [Bacteroidales bacterium]|nr:DUF1343 domain-containing protein [Bacteroidales bacterium]